MKMLKSISQNSGLDLDVNRFLKWLKGSKGPWNTSGTITMVSLSFLRATISSLKALHRAECPVSRGQAAKTPGGRFCNVFKFRDGRISSLHIYLDPDYTGEDEARFRWGKNRQW